MVEAGGRVDDHVAGGEFYGFRAVGVLDGKFSAIVFIGLGEKEGAGEVGADALAAWEGADGSIDVGAELLTAGVAVEHRRKIVERERCGHEEGICREGIEDDLSCLDGGGVIARDLHVVFCLGGLVASGFLAVFPDGGFEFFPAVGNLLRAEDIRNAKDHGFGW